MESKFLIDLIKKELEDLNVLVNEIITNNEPNSLLCEVAASKSQALHKELKLLSEKMAIAEESAIEPISNKILPSEVMNTSGELGINSEPTYEDEFKDEESFSPIDKSGIDNETIGWAPELNELNHAFSLEALIDPLFDNPTFNEIVDDNVQPDIEPETESTIEVEQESAPEPLPEIQQNEEIQPDTQSEIQPEDKPNIIENPSTEPCEIEVQEDEKMSIENQELGLQKSEEINTVEDQISVETIETTFTETVSSVDKDSKTIESFSITIVEEESKTKKVLGEKFLSELTLNDRLKDSVNVEPKFKESSVTDLRSAIGLNDRFLFIRELFENDSEKFNKAIDALNNSANLSAAAGYLENNFRWAKNDVSLKFIAILKRRFQS